MRKLCIGILCLTTSTGVFSQLVPISDEDMEDISGQEGLLNISRYDHAGNQFYRIGVNANIDTSVNIEQILLSDENGQPQIDISNLSLSQGLNNQVSSARISNPYIEFAATGSVDSDDISDREFIGVRFGADGIDGVLSFGDRQAVNGGSTPDGINSFRGFIKTSPITGTAATNPVNTTRVIDYLAAAWLVRPNLPCTSIGSFGFLGLGGACLGVQANSAVDVPGLNVDYFSQGVTLDSNLAGGASFTSAILEATNTNEVATGNLEVPATVLDLDTGGGGLVGAIAGLLINPGDVLTARIPNIRIPVGALDLTVNEDLGYLHIAELADVGGFLSFQNRTLEWSNDPSITGSGTLPGIADRVSSTTNAGWWMELTNEVDLGNLTIPAVSLPDDTVTQVVNEVVEALKFVNHTTSALTGVINIPNDVITGTITAELTNVPVSVLPINNCWNGTFGC